MEINKKISFQQLREQMKHVQMQIKQSQELFVHDFVIDNQTANHVNVTITMEDPQAPQEHYGVSSMIRVPNNTTIVHQLSQVVKRNDEQMTQLQKVKSQLMQKLNKTHSHRNNLSDKYNQPTPELHDHQNHEKQQKQAINNYYSLRKPEELENDNISKLIKINQTQYNDRKRFFEHTVQKTNDSHEIDDSNDLNQRQQRKQTLTFLREQEQYIKKQIKKFDQDSPKADQTIQESYQSAIKMQGKVNSIRQNHVVDNEGFLDKKIKKDEDIEEYRPKPQDSMIFTPLKKSQLILIVQEENYDNNKSKPMAINPKKKQLENNVSDKIIVPYSIQQNEQRRSSQKRSHEMSNQKSPEVYNYLSQRMKEYQHRIPPGQQKELMDFSLSSFSQSSFKKQHQVAPQRPQDDKFNFSFTPIKLDFKNEKTYVQKSRQQNQFRLMKEIERQQKRIDRFKQSPEKRSQKNIDIQSRSKNNVHSRTKTEPNLINSQSKQQEMNLLQRKRMEEIKKLQNKMREDVINGKKRFEMLTERKQILQKDGPSKWAVKKSDELFLQRKNEFLSKLEKQIQTSRKKNPFQDRQRSKSNQDMSKSFNNLQSSKRSISPKIKQISERLYNNGGKEPCPHEKRFNSTYYRQRFDILIKQNNMVDRNTTNQQKQELFRTLSKNKDSISFWPMKIVNYTLGKLSKLRQQKRKLIS